MTTLRRWPGWIRLHLDESRRHLSANAYSLKRSTINPGIEGCQAGGDAGVTLFAVRIKSIDFADTSEKTDLASIGQA